MAYKEHRNIITHFDPDNVLCDEHCSVKYRDIPGLLEGLHVFFEEYRNHEMSCIGISLPNGVLQTLTILYLLNEKINFFVASGQSNGSPKFPPFCDKVLTVVPGENERLRNISFSLADNPGYVRGQRAMRSHSGSAYFSSSGTTGAVKYICYRSDDLLRNAKKCIDRLGIHTSKRILITVPVNHMFGMGVGLLPALIMGARICLIEKNNVIKFFRYVSEFNPDIVLITPVLAKMILLLNKDIPGHRMYVSAGEKIDPETYRKFEVRYGLLVNLYGCTELGAIGTSPMDEASAASRLMGTVFPLPGVDVVISDGPYGEIYVRHDAGFEGYTDEDGKTEPPKLNEEGYFRTKDAGKMDASGGFTISGRVDNCVNRSGFLLSLDEVETKLKSLFGDFGQVVVFEDSRTDGILPRLIAVCEIPDEARKSDTFIKSECKRCMSRYAIPDDFIYVQQMPRLHNGKVDRSFIKNNFNSL